ncbi:MAG TPA: hypothetical protein VEY95_09220 [Azospirillaceae bacterium]|nr:hypothetical protein [Azospirillaceae bacterium]
MTSAITRGEVAITLAGAEHILKPSLQAFSRLAATGPYRDLLEKLALCDIGTMCFVLRHGLGWTDGQAQKLPDLVFRTGVSPLNAKLSAFVFALFNNGKTPDEFAAEQVRPGDGEGNGLDGD